MIKNIIKSWKTSLIGGGALTLGLVKFIQTGDIQACLPELIIGLLGLFAKDGDQTHSK